MNNSNGLANLVMMATVSTSVISLPFETDLELAVAPSYTQVESFQDWKDSAYSFSTGYELLSAETEKIQIILNFTKNILEFSSNLESEFLEIVDDNFWDLV